jgi:glutaminyl-tRNA synthetase
MSDDSKDRTKPSNFIEEAIEEDLRSGRFNRVATRFPPEPNGYLHIGHAKAIYINFTLAKKYGGTCNLRFDDTNPSTESEEYVRAIKEDIRWLGFDWEGREYYASDYFDQLYEWAVELIKKGLAYVDSLSEEEMREFRGNFYRKGAPSPYRERSAEENLRLFERMRAGEFEEGSHVLRAKISLDSQNMNLRDPVMYRIRHRTHHRTGDKWCIYPTYDWAHGQSDSIEGITHSICTLEFENHRPLYDWFLEKLEVHHPRQIEFARLNLTYTVLSKRRLIELVEKGIVKGWDDPRMPTLAGLRRRGFPPEAILNFCERVGVAKVNSVVDIGLLEHCVREVLNATAPRVMGVLKPLRVVITNYPEGKTEELDCPYNPEDGSWGFRKVPFSKVIYIERDDFREVPPKGWFRLFPGGEVRLRYAYVIRCDDYVKDPNTGEVVELRCSYYEGSRGGKAPEGKKIKGTIHWVSKEHACPAEIRLYDRLFVKEDPLDCEEGKAWLDYVNPESLVVVNGFVEPSMEEAKPGSRWQFERLGYFCVDSKDSSEGNLVFNRIVSLKDTWAKLERKMQEGAG